MQEGCRRGAGDVGAGLPTALAIAPDLHSSTCSVQTLHVVGSQAGHH